MLLSTQSVSSVLSVDFISLITGAFQNYSLIFDSVVSTGSSMDTYLMAQLSDDNGLTYQATNYMNYLGGSITTGVAMGLMYDSGSGIAYSTSGHVNFHHFLPATAVVTTDGQSTIFNPLLPTIAGQLHSGVYNGTPLVVDALRIVSSDGNPISGNFYLYGF